MPADTGPYSQRALMEEKTVRQMIGRSLRQMGYWPITQTDATRTQCPRCKAWVTAYPPKGRPDILVLHPRGASIVVECKVLKFKPGKSKSFAFNQIDDAQRRWLDRWLDDGGKGYICLGVIQDNPNKDELLGAWLVDWADWRATEEKFEGIQASIPYTTAHTRTRYLIDNAMDMVTMFGPHALQRDGEQFILPGWHSAIPQI